MGTTKVVIRRTAKKKDNSAKATVSTKTKTTVSGSPKTVKVTTRTTTKKIPNVRVSTAG